MKRHSWIYGGLMMVTSAVGETGCTVDNNNVGINCGVQVVIGAPGGPAPAPTPTPTPSPDQGQQGEPPGKNKWKCITWTDPLGDGTGRIINDTWEFTLWSAEVPKAEERTRVLWAQKYPIKKYPKYQLARITCEIVGKTSVEECYGGDEPSNTSSGTSGGDYKPQNIEVVVVSREEYLNGIDFDTLDKRKRQVISWETWQESEHFTWKSSDIPPSDTDE